LSVLALSSSVGGSLVDCNTVKPRRLASGRGLEEFALGIGLR
jgi:hypothetical protein